MTEIYVDADACPVKDEVLRVAHRHGILVHLVSNRWLRGADHPLIRRIVVPQGADAADDWIAERIGPGDIAVTGDIPLASRCLDRKARVLDSAGRPFTPDSIGMALAMRDLKAHFRETGDISGINPAFTKQDRSRFLSALEVTIQAIRRGR